LIVERLGRALASGAWDSEHGHLRAMEEYDGALRLVVSEPVEGAPSAVCLMGGIDRY
jgi:hypothetical protein